jgi:hypothetical protein
MRTRPFKNPALKGRAIRRGRPFGASDNLGALDPQSLHLYAVLMYAVLMYAVLMYAVLMYAVLSAEGASHPCSLPLQGQDAFSPA